jgi:hypothetical protein
MTWREMLALCIEVTRGDPHQLTLDYAVQVDVAAAPAHPPYTRPIETILVDHTHRKVIIR